MIWLSHETATTTKLPAAWVVETGAAPANLSERSALRRGLARRILARQLNVREDRLTISHDARGRPILEGGSDPAPRISLATRAGYVAVALANSDVGIDVEQVDPRAEIPLTALHPEEREALIALPQPARPLAFARIWSAKEAYVKALGLGFLRSPDSFCAVLRGNEGFVIRDLAMTRSPSGAGLFIKNGDQNGLVAAIVTLDQGWTQPG